MRGLNEFKCDYKRNMKKLSLHNKLITYLKSLLDGTLMYHAVAQIVEHTAKSAKHCNIPYSNSFAVNVNC